MITELPKDARQCSLSGVFITPDARVFKAGKNGFREVTVKADKKGPGKFYNSAEKKYWSSEHGAGWITSRPDVGISDKVIVNNSATTSISVVAYN